jgi:aminoglycoside phosphotransferase (APT) family kinase protein
VATGPTRDDDAVRKGLDAWLAHQYPDRDRVRVESLTRPSAGYSSETVIADLAWAGGTERVVLRFPLLVASYPDYDLRLQADVLATLGASPVPVPALLHYEPDPAWLGTEFLVMSFVAGRPIGEVPALDRWLVDERAARQRAVHEGFVQALAALHRSVDPAALAGRLRVGVGAEIDYWNRYISWAAGSDPPARSLVAAVDWCATTQPHHDAPDSLLWGDARLGNVMYDDDAHVVALLDWELATIGPAEMDLAWYLVLDALTTSFVKRTVPGFMARDELVRNYERDLGRSVMHLAWHEIFALVRSIAINDRQARLATASGASYPGVAGDANPILQYLDARIAAFTD